jgi:hypothetical protein
MRIVGGEARAGDSYRDAYGRAARTIANPTHLGYRGFRAITCSSPRQRAVTTWSRPSSVRGRKEPHITWSSTSMSLSSSRKNRSLTVISRPILHQSEKAAIDGHRKWSIARRAPASGMRAAAVAMILSRPYMAEAGLGYQKIPSYDICHVELLWSDASDLFWNQSCRIEVGYREWRQSSPRNARYWRVDKRLSS